MLNVNDDALDSYLWDMVEEKTKFIPNFYDNTHNFEGELPFTINEPYQVYGLPKHEAMEEFQSIVNDIFISITAEDEELYALDWNHPSYTFSPRRPETMQDMLAANEGTGRYNYYFPTYWPNADYYFFFNKDFSVGLLGHPWRWEIWVYGEPLIAELRKHRGKLGLKLLFVKD